jgi:topoisomerase-4 subunit A
MVEIGKEFGGSTALGRRRTEIGAAATVIDVPVHAFIEREPVTVLCSAKGWVRAVKGHNIGTAEQRYKEGDGPGFTIEAETVDKLLMVTSNGRFYTLGVDKLPGGRGHGEPLRLMIELANDAEPVAFIRHQPGGKLVLISSDGRGFIVSQDEALAQTRTGKQIMNPAEGKSVKFCLALNADSLALVGENRKLAIMPVADIPEMARGRGVMLQKYKDGGLADAKLINAADGLTWMAGTRQRTEPDLTPWKTGRGTSGRMVPTGFPRPTKFG